MTTFYVTHDQVEAMTMGDRVAVIKDGYLQQVDTPQNLYDQPDERVRRRLHRFTVDEPLRRRCCTSATAGRRSSSGRSRSPSPRRCWPKRPALRGYDGKRVVVGIRPEDFEDAAVVSDPAEDRRIKANVKLVEALGSEMMVHMAIDAKRVDSGDPDAPEELPGEGYANVVGSVQPAVTVRVDEDVDIVVNAENLHFFDGQDPRSDLGLIGVRRLGRRLSP